MVWAVVVVDFSCPGETIIWTAAKRSADIVANVSKTIGGICAAVQVVAPERAKGMRNTTHEHVELEYGEGDGSIQVLGWIDDMLQRMMGFTDDDKEGEVSSATHRAIQNLLRVCDGALGELMVKGEVGINTQGGMLIHERYLDDVEVNDYRWNQLLQQGFFSGKTRGEAWVKCPTASLDSTLIARYWRSSEKPIVRNYVNRNLGLGNSHAKVWMEEGLCFKFRHPMGVGIVQVSRKEVENFYDTAESEIKMVSKSLVDVYLGELMMAMVIGGDHGSWAQKCRR
jgi:hypothetical protein